MTVVYSNKPFRRIFARAFDIAFYIMFVNLFTIIVLNKDNIYLLGFKQYFFVLLPSFILMILVEPYFLSNFATTPGKYLMGIKLYNLKREKLSYKEALWRTVNMFFDGMGAGISILLLICLIRGAGKMKKGERMHHDRDTCFVVEELGASKIFSYIVLFLFIIVFIFSSLCLLNIPKNLGDITKDEYVENINYLAETNNAFFTIDEDGKLLGRNIRIYSHHCLLTATTYIYSGHGYLIGEVPNSQALPNQLMLPKEIEIIEQDGYVKEVSLNVISNQEYILRSYAEAMILSAQALNTKGNIINIADMSKLLDTMLNNNEFDFEYNGLKIKGYASPVGYTEIEDGWIANEGTESQGRAFNLNFSVSRIE